jgi:hypothetical protein
LTTPSPFAPYANTLLRFRVGDGTLAIDPKTGNRRPGTRLVDVVAVVQQKQRPRNKEMPGVDDLAVWVEGFLVNPRPLPPEIVSSSMCFGVWDGRQGRFHLDFTARNPYIAALNIDLVEKIKGFFQFQEQIPQEFLDMGDGLSLLDPGVWEGAIEL